MKHLLFKATLATTGLALLSWFIPTAHAAQYQFTSNGTTFTVGTGTDDESGYCLEEFNHTTQAFVGVSCVDGDALGMASVANGCGGIMLTGFCRVSSSGGVYATTQCNCAGGVDYTVTTGDKLGSCTP